MYILLSIIQGKFQPLKIYLQQQQNVLFYLLSLLLKITKYVLYIKENYNFQFPNFPFQIIIFYQELNNSTVEGKCSFEILEENNNFLFLVIFNAKILIQNMSKCFYCGI